MPRFTIRTLIILTTAAAAYCSVFTRLSGQAAFVWGVYLSIVVLLVIALR